MLSPALILGVVLLSATVRGAEPTQSDRPSSKGKIVGPTPVNEYVATLRKARKARESGAWEQALALVEKIPASASALIYVQALEIAATIHLFENRVSLALPLLRQLYDRAPGFELDDPSLPPKVTRRFEQQAARPHTRLVSPELKPVSSDLRGFDVIAVGDTAAVDVSCRSGTGPFLPITASYSKGRARFRLPSQERYQCYAVARDADGLPLGRLASPEAPLFLRARQPPLPDSPPVTDQWWFWTAIGGAVVTAVVVIAVAGTASEPSSPEADLTVELQPTNAATIFRW